MQRKTWTMLSALSVGLLAFGSGRANAGLIGSVVHGRYLYPNTGTVVVDGGTQTISSGTVFNFGDGTFTSVSFSDTQVTVTDTAGGYATAPFNGVISHPSQVLRSPRSRKIPPAHRCSHRAAC